MKCQKCGTEHNSNFCPNCGKKIKKPVSKGRKIAGIIIGILGLLMIFSIAINWEESPSTSSSAPTINSEQNENIETNNTEKVNYENFEKIQNGMTYEQVVEIFGKEGKILSESDIGFGNEYKTTLYYWYDNTGIANCNVTIQGGKVVAKAQVGLQ